MSDLNHRLQAEFDRLRTRRDELRVQIDLGKKDAQDAWEQLDEKWGAAETKMKELARHSRDTAGDVGDAADEIFEDAKEGLKLTAAEVGDAAEKLMHEVREGLKGLRNLL